MSAPSAPDRSGIDGDAALLEITELASRGVAGAEAAGLSLLRRGAVRTIAPTGTLASTLDEAQRLSGAGPCLTAISSHGLVVVEDLTTDRRWPAVHAVAAAAGMRSVLSLPLGGDGVFFGALNLYASGAGVFDDAAQQAGQAFAQQATTALRYRQLYEAEHAIAETLQRGLLPDIADVDGLAVAARYLPGETAQVGGDWYDLLPLPDGSVGLAIGDVVGHGVAAAAAMGQLRSVLRSYAWEGHHPAAVLDRLDHLVKSLGMADTATAVYARLTFDHQHGAQLDHANAGHPPPLVHQPDGTVRLLDEHGVLIGVPEAPPGPRPETTHILPPGATVLFYTDGLLENRHRHLDDGLTWLRHTAAQHHAAHGPQALCDAITHSLISGPAEDDIALLAVQIRP